MKAAFVPLAQVPLLASIGIEYSKVIALILVVPADIDVAFLFMKAHSTSRALTEVANIPFALASELPEAMLAPIEEGALVGLPTMAPEVQALDVGAC